MMRFAKVLIIGFFVLIASASLSFCQETAIDSLVDKYNKDTDIQRAAVVREYLGKKIAVAGVVDNVSDENTFDVVNDIGERYYKVVTQVANTPQGNPYRAVLIYKNIDSVKSLNKGQDISFKGNIIKVVDERLYISVWLSAEELTAHEKELFK
ncbi:MAG: hypothetical protein PHS46_04910 [Candidatus Omnitrophica bacterium]|nr:hypothetical protein [Candidatus Omnitrophota bacterium]